MEHLLKYHITNTEKQFETIQRELKYIDEKLDNLNEFKTRTIVTARYISFIVSAISGLATMLVSALISYYLQKGEH